MSQPEPPNYPKAVCPTCRREHNVALPETPGATITTLCGCGKVLLIERGNSASQLVVKEQYQPVATGVTPIPIIPPEPPVPLPQPEA